MSTITWLHISDLHFRPSQTYDADVVLNSLLKDVTKRIEQDKLQPNFIVLSGDIAFSSHLDEYSLAAKFLDELLKTTGLKKDRLFLVPGNHDVDRSAITKGASLIADGLKDRDSVTEILDSEQDRALIFRRFHNYESFIKEYLGEESIPSDDTHYYYVKHVKIAGKNIGILGLNSCWLSPLKEDYGGLLIGERQIRAALKRVKEVDLCLAVMHHPFDWLQGFDRSDTEPLLCDKCDFVLHGHLHQTGLSQITTPGTSSMMISAGASYEKRKLHNSYNFVQLDLSTFKGTIYLRTYSDNQGGFWTKDTVTYRNTEDGVYSFDLPPTLHPTELGKNNKDIFNDSIPYNIKSPRIPLPPNPYFAHPYPPPENFTGREDERKMLTSWLNNDERQILALVAMGGMGKSFLSWHWLQNDVDFLSLDGTLWWSFYEGESSFSKFLDDSIIYTSGQTIDPSSITSDFDKTQILVNLSYVRQV